MFVEVSAYERRAAGHAVRRHRAGRGFMRAQRVPVLRRHDLHRLAAEIARDAASAIEVPALAGGVEAPERRPDWPDAPVAARGWAGSGRADVAAVSPVSAVAATPVSTWRRLRSESFMGEPFEGEVGIRGRQFSHPSIYAKNPQPFDCGLRLVQGATPANAALIAGLGGRSLAAMHQRPILHAQLDLVTIPLQLRSVHRIDALSASARLNTRPASSARILLAGSNALARGPGHRTKNATFSSRSSMYAPIVLGT